MSLLTRQLLIDQLRAARAASGADGMVPVGVSQRIAGWAFDQFYAEEEGTVEFEPGYRRLISATLDDLMFSDQPDFQLAAADLDRRIADLEQATPVADEMDDDWQDEDDPEL